MEGCYKTNWVSSAAEEAETGNVTNPEGLKKDEKTDKNKRRHPKMIDTRFPSFRKNLYDYFIEYSSYTSIQGIRYVGEQSRSIVERLAWLIFICVSLYFCINQIIQSYNKWDTSPVLISFATSLTPVWKIPFPAVTICSETKARQTIFNVTDIMQKIRTDNESITEEEMKHYADLSIICNEVDFRQGNLTTGYDAIEFYMKVAPKFDKMFWVCKSTIFNEECSELFTPILTGEGICHTFNMLDRSEIFRDNVFHFGDFMSHKRASAGWTAGAGYEENTSIDTYPRRLAAAGYPTRLTLFLVSYKNDLDYACRGPEQGYKIMLHNPAETPNFLSFFHASHEKGMMLGIKPEMITTSYGLKNYDPHRRKCYFPEERHLAFYRSYSQANCDYECLTNYTRNKCNCVLHDMPRIEETPICGAGSIKCMIEATHDLLQGKARSIINKTESDPNYILGCDCLPGCTSLIYNAEVSQTELNVQEFLNTANIDYGSNIMTTTVKIFFKEQQFMTSERNELFGKTDFLASCGGLLGLFTGFSFLSIIEILYFLSLRLFCNIKRYGKHYWSGSQELINNDRYHHKN